MTQGSSACVLWRVVRLTTTFPAAISQSAEAMAAMNALVNVPIMSATMRTLAREMEKAGFIQEMVEDTLGGEELSDEADEEIDKGERELRGALFCFCSSC